MIDNFEKTPPRLDTVRPFDPERAARDTILQNILGKFGLEGTEITQILTPPAHSEDTEKQ
jgi:hypothetical protein